MKSAPAVPVPSSPALGAMFSSWYAAPLTLCVEFCCELELLDDDDDDAADANTFLAAAKSHSARAQSHFAFNRVSIFGFALD